MPEPLDEVRFDQRLGGPLPLDAVFADEAGREVALQDYFADRPVVLALVYYGCPMLCNLVMDGIAKSLGVISLDPGRDFEVVVVSFDPGETPAMAQQAKAKTLERYGRPQTAAGWHFLTGDEATISRLADAVGFRFVYDPASDEYAHASGIVVATPDGVINQYYYGIDYPPKDVRLALVEASERRIGTLVDQLLLYCYRYDPSLGRYTAVAMRAVRLAGVVFVLGLLTFLLVMWRRERSVDRETLGAA
ncbi:MAG: SCO family protein [Acidobacteria bacterium]|nr:MAG: SCO family protein [Acidobacteriota bacterium]